MLNDTHYKAVFTPATLLYNIYYNTTLFISGSSLVYFISSSYLYLTFYNNFPKFYQAWNLGECYGYLLCSLLTICPAFSTRLKWSINKTHWGATIAGLWRLGYSSSSLVSQTMFFYDFLNQLTTMLLLLYWLRPVCSRIP